ncbi:hypothetical protein LX16_4259 [Stackebrandtia albiflava]|uniref:Uncharacterized protein n=1 Tax=Stackebrandtia albiflava TaxID=406432 RepID=A0A562UZ02_9ACTN|nr:hypothetical protein [Stackebrandtia albiflava]TWJ10835.1 hypothetical protein LX16_4259 [Stackebrandtia albiflava]
MTAPRFRERPGRRWATRVLLTGTLLVAPAGCGGRAEFVDPAPPMPEGAAQEFFDDLPYDFWASAEEVCPSEDALRSVFPGFPAFDEIDLTASSGAVDEAVEFADAGVGGDEVLHAASAVSCVYQWDMDAFIINFYVFAFGADAADDYSGRVHPTPHAAPGWDTSSYDFAEDVEDYDEPEDVYDWIAVTALSGHVSANASGNVYNDGADEAQTVAAVFSLLDRGLAGVRE